MGLSLRNIGRKITDIFDANSQEDQRKRVAAGQPQMYREQQKAMGNTRPAQNFGSAVLGNTARLVNTMAAVVPEVSDTKSAVWAQIRGDKEDLASTNARIAKRQEYQYNPTSGLFGAGTLFDNAQDMRTKGTVDLIKDVGATTAGTGLEIAPMAKGAGLAGNALYKGASVPAKVALRTGAGALEGAGQDFLDQQITRDHFSPLQTAASAAFGGLLPNAAPASRVVAAKAKPLVKAAGETITEGVDNLNLKPLNQVGAVGKSVDPLESLKQEARKYKSAEEFDKFLFSRKQAGDPVAIKELDSLTKEAQKLVDSGVDSRKATNQVLRNYQDRVTLTPEKYSNLDEFLQAQGKPLYHGTDAKFDRFSLNNFGKTDDGFSGKGVYLSGRKGNAKQYGKNVVDSYVSLKNPFEYEDSYAFGAFSPGGLRRRLGLPENASADAVTAELKRRGHDGIVINENTGKGVRKSEEVVVLDPNQIKTKQQLTDLYNQATKTVPVESKTATGARSDYSPENLQANRQIRVKNASSITYADKKTINPDELVTVYRAVPGKAKGGLVEGDWVTPNKEQARLFMKQSWAQDDTGAKIVTKKVKASELRYHADDAKGYVDDELLYVPQPKKPFTPISQPVDNTPAIAKQVGAVGKSVDPIADLQSKLPKGYKADKTGSVFDPKGKELTLADVQSLTQPKYLTDYEAASNVKDEAKMSKIAAEHPDDIRVHIHEDGNKWLTPLNETGAISATPSGKPKVSLKQPKVTNDEIAMGKALGMSKQDVIAAKADMNIPGGKLTTEKLVEKSGKTGEDLVDLSPREQMLLHSFDDKTVKELPDFAVTSKKDPAFKALLQDLSRSENGSRVKGELVASQLSTKARELDVKLDAEFIHRYQTGKLKPGNEEAMGSFIKHTVTDPIFNTQKMIDDKIEYRKNYVPQSYQQGDDVVQDATRRFRTETGSANQRAFGNYKEAEKFGLTPKYNNLEQILGDNATQAERALARKQVVESGLEKGIFSSRPSNGTPLQGFFDLEGKQLYAPKEIAETINGVLQKPATGPQKAAHTTAKTFSHLQDVMLQGGIPGTNFNFFTASQALKDTTRNIGKAPLHPIQAAKQEGHIFADLFSTKSGTQKRFAEKSDFIKKMADRNLYISHQSKMTGVGDNAFEKQWNKLGNNPTFGRYMPNRMLSTAEEVYTQAKKGGLSEEAALDLAANTTKRFNGIVDHIAKGESGLSQDGKSIMFFAPKYRESILNALANTAKSLNPKTMKAFGGDGSYAASRELLTGMGMTLAAYEVLNREITGHSMMENREGQELSVEIPYGEKDEKGNQKVVNVPFMPGFMTLPRAAVGAAGAIARGDVKGVGAEASKVLSAPLQTAGNILSNKDYFGRPIYNDQKTADNEGVDPDNAVQAAGKILAYAGGQSSPAWVRGGIGIAQGKPMEQNVATALEAPVRFGKHLNPETTAYFKDKEEIYNSLDKNEKAVWDTVHPKQKNSGGDYMTEKTVDHGLARASNYLNNPKVLAAENEMARRAKSRGQKIDPLYDLDEGQQRIALRMDTLAPGDPVRDKLKKDNPWYKDLGIARNDFYESLPKGDPNKPKGPITYPEPNAQVSSKMDAYTQLEDPKMKAEFLSNNPDVTDQFSKQEQYTRAVRAMKDLPQYDKYPETPPQLQKIMDEYAALPKGDGKTKRDGTASSPTRSNWIKSHPKEWAAMSDQFSKIAQFNLQNAAEMANFEGEDMSEKGIKAIASLGGGSGSGGGYGGSGGKKDYKQSDYKYAVSLRAGGRAANIEVSKPKVAAKKSGGGSVASKPKVSMKKSLV